MTINKTTRDSGFTLLLTLMTLVLLASVIVIFQSNTAIQVRASGHRVALQQCRYAAESALIMASKLIRDTQEQQLDDAIQARKVALEAGDEGAEGKEENVDVEPISDGDDMIDEEDPNDILDPNEFEGEEWAETDLVTKQLPFVFLNKTVDIGEASVEIEIYDENSRFPVYWVIHSPIYRNDRPITTGLDNLAKKFRLSSISSRKVRTLSEKLSRPLKVPEPQKYIYGQSSTSTRTRARTSSMRLRNSRRGDSELSFKEHEQQLYQTMAIFSQRWKKEITTDENYENLIEELYDQPGTFNDYLGVWGHNRLNLNSAPVEVLESAFKPFGFTPAMAEALVKYREETPLTNTVDLAKIPEIGKARATIRNIRSYSTVTSDTFSVRIKATLGSTQYSLIGGIYYSVADKTFINHAVFSGD